MHNSGEGKQHATAMTLRQRVPVRLQHQSVYRDKAVFSCLGRKEVAQEQAADILARLSEKQNRIEPAELDQASICKLGTWAVAALVVLVLLTVPSGQVCSHPCKIEQRLGY